MSLKYLDSADLTFSHVDGQAATWHGAVARVPARARAYQIFCYPSPGWESGDTNNTGLRVTMHVGVADTPAGALASGGQQIGETNTLYDDCYGRVTWLPKQCRMLALWDAGLIFGMEAITGACIIWLTEDK